MARDMENPDTQGKDLNMNDTRPECIRTGCHDLAEPGSRTCQRHDDEGVGHTNTGP